MSILRIESYVSGQWQPGAQEGAELLDPATEAVVARADTSGVDFGRALDFARGQGGPALRALDFSERAGLIGQMSAALHTARELLIESAILNGGCTRSDAKFDVDGAIGTLAAYAEIGKALGSRRVLVDEEGIQLGRSPKFWGQHVYLPKVGVAVLINAFNFPTWGFAEKAACALLAGMPVITKPATATALTGYLASRAILDAAILPRGALSFVGGAAGDLLDHLGGQDVLAFTGSAETGRKLRGRANLIERGVVINVEADSLNAAVLGPDVEPGSETWQLFIKEVAKDITQKTGQKCTAIRRILVPAAHVAGVEHELSARFAEIRVGHPALREVGMGPLATRDQLDEVQSGVKRLLAETDLVFGTPGASVAALGTNPGKGFFHPILLLRARSSLTPGEVHTREIFGPVATVVSYDGQADQATAIARLGEGSLVSALYSDDRFFSEKWMHGAAPFHGRLYFANAKVADQTPGPGTVLPSCTHGGPGRAGGGEELGGLRGVRRFMQRTVLQGYRPMIETIADARV